MTNGETVKYLTQDEARRLLATAAKSKRDRALFLLAYRHGLRASEIGLLQRSDFDARRLRIRVQRLKGSLSGEYPVQPDVAKAISAYLRSRDDDSPYLFISEDRKLPLDRKALHWLMRKHAATAGLPAEKRHFHALRHSICTHLLDAGADVSFVKDWAGHKNIQNTMVYAQITNHARNEGAKRFFASGLVV